MNIMIFEVLNLMVFFANINCCGLLQWTNQEGYRLQEAELQEAEERVQKAEEAECRGRGQLPAAHSVAPSRYISYTLHFILMNVAFH